AHVKRAPNSIADRVAQIPGVGTVQAGISVQVTLDLVGLDEPASGMVRSLPDYVPAELNKLFLRKGSWLTPGSYGEVLVGEAFAEANQLEPGDRLAMLLNGRRKEFRIAGIVLSPEFIFESRPGAALPDNRTYGVFWMPYKEVSTAFDLYGAFNYLSLTLSPGASPKPVIAELDRLLKPHGGAGAYGRIDHPSHIRVSDEIRVLQTLSIGFPVVFLSVAAFMTNAVLTRLLALQREQIAILKAFGFGNRQIVMHYLKFAFVMVVCGTAIGALGGYLLGGRLVHMYKMFFRFPELVFRYDRSAVAIAVLVGVGAAIAGVLGAVRKAAQLPPADAMRPEPPANFKPSIIERTGISRFFSHSFRIAVRNLERRPAQAFFTIAGLALATGILIVPNCFRDSVSHLLGFQWDVVQRQDINVGLVEPSGIEVQHLLRDLPGVVAVEPFRSAGARIRFGQRSRQLAIQGLPADTKHSRVVDKHFHEVPVPDNGLVISTKLAEVLEVKIGDELEVEILEGRRPVKFLKLMGLSDDLTGIAAHMELHSLNRLLGEGDIMTGASFTIDGAHRRDFLIALKEIPRVSWVGIKESLRENFRKTTAASINLIQSIYLVFATVVALGVVYNNARISLAERSRELATLRVIGFSEREVAQVLIIELAILSLIALPLGLLLGTGFATGIVTSVNTETVRLPLIFTAHNYAFATLVVALASTAAAVVVLRRLKELNLVSALKAPE
ncbi:MAG TPA: FtsX-like permease family protein, partial [Roseimicrobium sp.]|nr:FtsX-like permease family protein [Roseimicrobium sp.]